MVETVLVVENEGPARDFLSRQLADDGFEVFAADRAVAALELVESRRLDLVLLDAVLPDASGFELCGRLRSGEPGRAWDRDLPVIMVSARGDPSDRVRGFARGADDYVIKPFVYEELVALAEDPERVFRKEELLRDVWGFRSLGRTRTLDSHASRLRRKLDLNGEAAYVVNVWGVGYRLVAAA